MKDNKLDRLTERAKKLMDDIEIGTEKAGAEETETAEKDIEINQIKNLLKNIEYTDQKVANEVIEIIKGVGDDLNETEKNEISSDAKAIVQVSPDKMEAYVTFVSPFGNGKKLKAEDVKTALANSGVVNGIDEDLILKTCEKVNENPQIIYYLPVANGDKPVDGENGRIEMNFDVPQMKFRELADGRIDFHEQNLITNVVTGQLLAERFPPGKGKPGMTVTGQKINAAQGMNVVLHAGDNVHTDNVGTKYFASISGQVQYIEDILKVNPVFIVEKDVDYSTGNINFFGNVVVKGSVIDGFNVRATGDVVVHDNVGASDITIEGSLMVRNGILGKDKGKISSGTNVTARFVENANIESAGDIVIRNVAMHSRLVSNSGIYVTSQKGLIIGGVTQAAEEIEAINIGTPLGTPTEIIAGIDFLTQKSLGEVDSEISHSQTNLVKIEQLIEAFKRATDNLTNIPEDKKAVFSDLLKKKMGLKKNIRRLGLKRIRLIGELKKDRMGRIKVSGNIYPGVKIMIKDQVMQVNERMSYVTFSFDTVRSQIRIGPY